MSIKLLNHSAILAATLAGLIGPASAATYLTNPDFGGVTGVTVTTNGPGSANTSSPGWYQFTVVPGGTLSTTLAPSTAPAGGGNQIHVVTDSGDYAPAEQGNGFGQSFIGGALLKGAKLTYELDVLHGSVTGGLTKYTSGIGVFTPTTPTHGPTNGWITVTDTLKPGDLAAGIFFETLTTGQGVDWGANYYVADVTVTAGVPEPSTWAMMLLGFAGLAFAGRGAARQKSRMVAIPSL